MKRLLASVVALFVLVGCAHPPSPPPQPELWKIVVTVDKVGVVATLVTDDNVSHTPVVDGLTFTFSSVESGHKGGMLSLSFSRGNYIFYQERVITTGENYINVNVPSLGRTGIVTLNNRAMQDAMGVFNPLGASLFWAIWGEKNDPTKYANNLASLREMGVDYIRILGVVGPDFWQDRTITRNDALQYLGPAIDRAYDEYGIRTQLTIFGVVSDTARDREAFVDALIPILLERSEKVMLVEVVNEPFSIGMDSPEIRALARKLKNAIPNLVTLGAFGFEGACPLYSGSVADLTSVHYDRTRPGGPWNAVRQPWGYPLEYEIGCDLPPTAISNEPIGPQSSVASDDDPLRLVMSYATVFVAGNTAYTFHSGPGIRGGGIEDLNRQRSANFNELPLWNEYVRGFNSVKQLLPAGVSNWMRENAQWVGFPFSGCDSAVTRGDITRCYATHTNDEFIVVMLGQRVPFVMTAKRAMSFNVIDPMSGMTVATHVLNENESYTTDSMEGAILQGRWQ